MGGLKGDIPGPSGMSSVSQTMHFAGVKASRVQTWCKAKAGYHL